MQAHRSSDQQAAVGHTQARVAALFVHPLKSAAAIEVDVLALDDRGAVGDRRWLVVDPDGRQITARETPQLCLVRPSFVESPSEQTVRTNHDGAVTLDAPALESLTLELPASLETCEVRIWADRVPAVDAGDAAAAWISAAIARPARIVRLADSARRPLQAKYSGSLPWADRRVAFSDGAPLLLLGHGSLDALNARLLADGKQTVTVARFRPNVLLSQTVAHEEDTWRDIYIGDVMIAVGEPCARCVMTTIDPVTALGGMEPTRTLASYRRQNGSIMFGMNATNAAVGVLRRGDVVRLAP